MNYLLDTNTLIYFFKGIGNVSGNLLSVSPQDIAIPALVLFEIEVGIAKSNSPQKRLQQLQDLISVVDVLPFGAREARHSARIRVELEKSGTPIGAYDVLIAASAIANKATLVTHNQNEFARIKDLKIVDWY